MVVVAAPTSRRQRKKDATRESIHEAALGLTEELGLARVTLEAITERADVAPRTFFNYFSSKVHAVLGKDPDRADRLQKALDDRPLRESPLAALRHVLLEDFFPSEAVAEHLLRRLAVVRSEPTLLSTMHAEFEEMERVMVAAIARRTGQRAGTDVYPSLVVAAAVGAMRTSLMRWAERDGRDPLEPIVDEAFDLLSHGLIPPATESIFL